MAQVEGQLGGRRSVAPITAVRDGSAARVMVLTPLLILLVLWLWIVAGSASLHGGPNGVTFANSFGTYLGAAQALKQHGNPWDSTQSYRAERQLLLPQGVEVNEPTWNRHVGNPPLFLWALEPLTALPFRVAALLWVAAMYLLAALGFLTAARHLGWRRPLLPCLIFLLMPQTLVGAYYGEAYALLFAALALALVLAPRHPVATGLLLSVALLKPPVGLPLAGLIWLFHAGDRRRCALAFLGANALVTILTIVLVGGQSLVQWVVGIVYFSREMALQPHVASLIGMYVGWAPLPLRAVLEGTTILGAGVLTLVTWQRRRDEGVVPFRAVAWLWFVWFLASPYSHFYDELMLTIPMLVLCGPDGRDLKKPLPAAGLYAAFFSLLVVSWLPGRVSLLPVPLLMLAYLLHRLGKAVLPDFVFPGRGLTSGLIAPPWQQPAGSADRTESDDAPYPGPARLFGSSVNYVQ